MKILWIVPKATFPVDDGARVATSALASEVAKISDVFDIIYFGDSDISDLYKRNWNVRKTFILAKSVFKSKKDKIRFWLLSLLRQPSTPLTCSPYIYFKNHKIIEKILSEKYDLIVFDGLHSWAGFRKYLKDYEGPIAYRAHNVESEIWRTAATQRVFPISLFFRWQSLLMKRLESELVERSQRVWAISDEDEKYFEVQNKNTMLVPVGMNFQTEKSVHSGSLKLLFLGRMDWAPNKDGLTWFLNEVWNEVLTQRSDIELFIAGSGDSSWLRSYKNKERTHILGRVESVTEIYQKVDLSIIPIFYGSGTRIKVIESVGHRVGLLSTRMGAQGSGLYESDYFSFEKSSEWIQVLKTMTREDINSVEMKAYQRLKRILDPNQIATGIIKSFHRD